MVPPHILIVDDEPTARLLLRAQLEFEDMVVTEAGSVVEAQEAASDLLSNLTDTTPVAIIVDVRLRHAANEPDMDGPSSPTASIFGRNRAYFERARLLRTPVTHATPPYNVRVTMAVMQRSPKVLARNFQCSYESTLSRLRRDERLGNLFGPTGHHRRVASWCCGLRSMTSETSSAIYRRM